MIDGVTENSGVVLSSEASAYLALLRASLPSSVPIHVTSGTRTSSAQAKAMLDKMASAEANAKSGADELHSIYKNDALIDVLLKLPRDLSVWTATIESRRLAGDFISAHQRGDSFDLRSKDLNSAAIAAIKAAILATGGKYLHESYPPHIHVDIPAGDPATWRALPGASAIAGGLGVVGIGGGLAAIAGALAIAGYAYTSGTRSGSSRKGKGRR